MKNKNTLKIKEKILGDGIPLICVPVTGSSEDEILTAFKEAVNCACDAIEWRVDMLEKFQEPERVKNILEQVREILMNDNSGHIFIFTVRTESDGGAEVDRDTYFELVKLALKKADLIDIEINAGEERVREFVNSAHLKGRSDQTAESKIIVSYHDFKRTPSVIELVDKMRLMQDTGADIVKVAVMPYSGADVDALIDATRLMRDKYAKVPLITMSMGKLGRRSRIEGEEYGSSMTFGIVNKASAPGQIELEELHAELEKFHLKTGRSF